MYSVVYMCTDVHQYVCIFVFVRVHVFGCVLYRFRSRSCDPDSLTRGSDLWPLWTWYTGDSKTNQWNDPEIRTGFRVVKSRRRFGSKIASFHMSVYSCIISLLSLPVDIHVPIYIISYDYLMYLPVWLPVSLHETANVYFHTIVDSLSSV